MYKDAIIVDRNDNVATAIREINKGESIRIDQSGNELVLTIIDDIQQGFKLALRDIDTGQPVIKYGEVIGLATIKIAAGESVHIHNVEGLKGRGDKK